MTVKVIKSKADWERELAAAGDAPVRDISPKENPAHMA
jgi:hypothetical protein